MANAHNLNLPDLALRWSPFNPYGAPLGYCGECGRVTFYVVEAVRSARSRRVAAYRRHGHPLVAAAAIRELYRSHSA